MNTKEAVYPVLGRLAATGVGQLLKNVLTNTAVSGGIGGTVEVLTGLNNPQESRSALQRFGEGFKDWGTIGAGSTLGGGIGGGIAGKLSSKPIVHGIGKTLGTAGGLVAALPSMNDVSNTPEFSAPSPTADLQLPQALQDNPNLPLLHFNHMMQPQNVNFNLTDPTFNKNLKFIHSYGKSAIPPELMGVLSPIIAAIDNNESVANLNLSPAQLRKMQQTLVWQANNNPALKQHMQSKWVADTMSGIYNQLDSAIQQTDKSFANLDPSSPEYAPTSILNNYILKPEQYQELQTKQQDILSQIEGMQATGEFTEDQITSWIHENAPEAGDMSVKLGLHELISQKLQLEQQGKDTTGILEQINNLVETGTANLSDPAVMQNVTEQFQYDTGISSMMPDALKDLYGWFMGKEGWEQAAIMAGISLGTAGLITALFSDNMLMALIMAVLGAGTAAAGISEVREPVMNYISQLTAPKENEEPEVKYLGG